MNKLSHRIIAMAVGICFMLGFALTATTVYSIVTTIKPYNWVVGTGNYTDDIDKELMLQKEEVSASTEEQASVIQQIAISAKKLTELAGRLQQDIDKFKV